MAGRRLMPRVVGILVVFLGVLSMQPASARSVAASTADGATTLSLANRVVHWHGTVNPGTSGSGSAVTLRCLPTTNPTTDDYAFNLTGLTPSFLSANRVKLVIRIDWIPNVNANANDLNLTTFYTDAAGTTSNIADSTQTGTVSESTGYASPKNAEGPAKWHASACAGTNASPQAYTGTATIVVKPLPILPPDPVLPSGSPSFTNYDFPDVDPWKTAGSNEPSLGVDTRTGKIMYQDNIYTTRITFDDSKKPAAAKFEDVSPLTNATSLDPILFLDPVNNRTFSSQLVGACSLTSYTDDDGKNWIPSQGCGLPAGPDHQTIGGGPFPAAQVVPHTFDRAYYYCSQGIAAAFCAQSRDGGMTFGNSVPIYNATDCKGLHGHIKVGPDGTAYVPHGLCTNGKKGAIVSEDGGTTWSVRLIPETDDPEVPSTAGSFANSPEVGHDPSIGIAPDDGTVYEGWIAQKGEFKPDNPDARSFPKAAVSHDHGKTWSLPRLVGQEWAIRNADFATVVAGTGGRAAFAFIGSKTPGVAYQSDFPGTWYLYVAFTTDSGRSWQTVNATINDPVQRGCVWNSGGGNPCRNMLDFNDITVDTSGRVLVAYTDGCTGKCVTDTSLTPYEAVAGIVRQNVGPSIIAACGTSFQPGCATPTLQGKLVSGTIPNTSAAPAPALLPLGAAALVAGCLWTAARRRQRRPA